MLRRIGNNKGVTLVELILVIAVVGLIMAAAVSFFLFGTRTFSLGSNQARVQQEARLATTIVNQDLRTSLNVRVFEVGETIISGVDDYVVQRIGTDPGPYSLRYVRTSGTLETDDVFTSLSFSVQENSTTGKKFIVFNATGEENGRDYTINNTMLLENDQSQLDSKVGLESYIAIVFEK